MFFKFYSRYYLCDVEPKGAACLVIFCKYGNESYLVYRCCYSFANYKPAMVKILNWSGFTLWEDEVCTDRWGTFGRQLKSGSGMRIIQTNNSSEQIVQTMNCLPRMEGKVMYLYIPACTVHCWLNSNIGTGLWYWPASQQKMAALQTDVNDLCR